MEREVINWNEVLEDDDVRAPQLRALTAIELGRLALAFGSVSRATYHEDGDRPESDATHTVMLGLVACALCPDDLDRGLVAEFALVHDLAEALAGDTNSFDITPSAKEAKREREARAMAVLRERFEATAPWLVVTLDNYERQDIPEARFVRYLDKAMPKITHLLNGGAALLRMGKAPDDVVRAHKAQHAALAAEYRDIPPRFHVLMADLMELAEGVYRRAGGSPGFVLEGIHPLKPPHSFDVEWSVPTPDGVDRR